MAVIRRRTILCWKFKRVRERAYLPYYCFNVHKLDNMIWQCVIWFNDMNMSLNCVWQIRFFFLDGKLVPAQTHILAIMICFWSLLMNWFFIVVSKRHIRRKTKIIQCVKTLMMSSKTLLFSIYYNMILFLCFLCFGREYISFHSWIT